MRGFNLEKEENKADEQYKSIIEALRAAAPEWTRLKSDNVRKGCRLQDKGAVQGRSGPGADSMPSLAIAAGERRSLLGVEFENMGCSRVMR